MVQKSEQEARLDYLLREFKEDSGQYRNLETGEEYEEKRMTLRSLMNIRMPRYMPEEVLKVQDEFLADEAREKGIITLSEIPDAREQYGCGHSKTCRGRHCKCRQFSDAGMFYPMPQMYR